MYEISFRGTPPCARALAYVRERCLPQRPLRHGVRHYQVTVEPSARGRAFAVKVAAQSAGQRLEAQGDDDDVILALEQAFGGV